MWTLLLNEVEWTKYLASLSDTLSLRGHTVDWGKGPKTYPCLVSSLQVNSGRVASAYVYEADAVRLLDSIKVAERAHASAPAAASTICPAQDLFNKSITAHVLALLYFVRETLYVKPEIFEGKYNEALSLVDQLSSERRDAILSTLDPTNRSVVDRLLPRGG